jgi:glycosyltransferase involved in cell wall biosynthesis
LYYGANNRFYSAIRYLGCFHKLIKEYIRLNGKPDLAHVHVVFRAGLIALYLRYRYGTRYIVSEHWSLFNDAALSTFNRQPFFKRWLIKLIYRKASACTAVSHHLSDSIVNKIATKVPWVIPNVFDSSLFYLQQKNNEVFKFIHISQLNHAKNPEQILEAAEILLQLTNKKFKLTIYGPYIKNLRVNEEYTDYRQEVPQHELATDVRTHDALILYSRYEGLPCVVIEALAAGVPAIVSDIPSMHELITHGINGLIVPLNDPETLAKKMLETMNTQFNRQQIAESAKAKYSFRTVGKQFENLYNSIPTSPTQVR